MNVNNSLEIEGPKVFVPCRTQQNLRALDNFGRIVFVSNRYIYGDEVSLDGEPPKNFADRIAYCVSKYDPETDYLAIVGDHLALLMFAVAATARYGRVRVLRYDRVAAGYYPATLKGLCDVENI